MGLTTLLQAALLNHWAKAVLQQETYYTTPHYIHGYVQKQSLQKSLLQVGHTEF